MNLDSNTTALVTGASGGLGIHISRALAKAGVNQVLVAYPGVALPPLRDELNQEGIRAQYLVADLRKRAERHRVVKEVGHVDVLINNAGVEFTAPYHELSEEDVAAVLDVNLTAPMELTRLLLPGMLERRRGHIVNMSSLAGKSGPAYQEPYAATKAALIAFTTSLRASYRGSGVSASVICPGFVEAGIYARIKAKSGCAAPALLGTTSPESVARAVVKAIRSDRAQTVVNKWPVRPLFAVTELCPGFGAWLTRLTGAHAFFRRVHQALKAAEGAEAPHGHGSRQESARAEPPSELPPD